MGMCCCFPVGNRAEKAWKIFSKSSYKLGTSYYLLHFLKAMHHINNTDRKALTQELKQRPEALLILLSSCKNICLIVTHIYLEMTGVITSCC